MNGPHPSPVARMLPVAVFIPHLRTDTANPAERLESATGVFQRPGAGPRTIVVSVVR